MLARHGDIDACAVWVLNSSGDTGACWSNKEKWGACWLGVDQEWWHGCVWGGRRTAERKDVFAVGVDKQWRHVCSLGGCYANGQWPAKPTEMM